MPGVHDSNAARAIPSRVPSSIGEESNETLIEDQPANGKPDDAKAKPKAKKSKEKKNAMTETKAEGGVKWRVLVLYLRAMGPWWFWVLAVMVFGVQQVGALGANIWSVVE
ncbi:hypothetical protein PX690_21305 [Bacillus velezensis]|uniref:hypothetical protein n=1 Tax=Bacillus velezensis TaxID=492670 RepID=UPI0023E26EEB|nr:hypothetical protein [Bacillus velezensis]WES02014.1 hypothetical protein PX690_21305 [Bacillus velezensis]